jgi:hypothetical protein
MQHTDSSGSWRLRTLWPPQLFTRVVVTMSRRAAASTFFTSLRAEVDNPESVFTEAQRQTLQPLLEPRDQMSTLLARTDPAAAERLADLYNSYRQVR